MITMMTTSPIRMIQHFRFLDFSVRHLAASINLRPLSTSSFARCTSFSAISIFYVFSRTSIPIRFSNSTHYLTSFCKYMIWSLFYAKSHKAFLSFSLPGDSFFISISSWFYFRLMSSFISTSNLRDFCTVFNKCSLISIFSLLSSLPSRFLYYLNSSCLESCRLSSYILNLASNSFYC